MRNTRHTRIDIRLTPDLKERLQAKAQNAGYSLSEFIRECAETGEVRPILSINLQQWSRLGGLSNNLNQLARHANEGGNVSEDLGAELRQMREIVEVIRRDLVQKGNAA